MSVELISVLIAVVAVGATLAGLMLSGQRAIRAELAAQRQEFSAELAAQRQEFNERFTALEQNITAQITALEQQIAELRERMAHLEGLLDGLREAITIPRGAA